MAKEFDETTSRFLGSRDLDSSRGGMYASPADGDGTDGDGVDGDGVDGDGADEDEADGDGVDGDGADGDGTDGDSGAHPGKLT